jgi:hypothetical protein
MLIGFLYPMMMLSSLLKTNKEELKELQSKHVPAQSFYAISKFSSHNLPKYQVHVTQKTTEKLKTTTTTTTTEETTTSTSTTTTTIVTRVRRLKKTTRRRPLPTPVPKSEQRKAQVKGKANPSKTHSKPVNANEEMVFHLKPRKTKNAHFSNCFGLLSPG